MRSMTAMSLSWILLAFVTLPAVAGARDSKLEVKDLQNHPFNVDFPSGSKLRLQLRSGDFRIIGSGDNKISVRLEGRNADRAQDLTVRFHRAPDESDLRIFGGPKNELQVTIEVPKVSNLFVRMPAGELDVKGISGDKDIELHAGELAIEVGSVADYARVDASVLSGDLEGAPFHESHGGLFRSFTKSGTGKYKLHAHVGAGQLTLQ